MNGATINRHRSFQIVLTAIVTTMSLTAAAGLYGSGQVLDSSAGGEFRYDERVLSANSKTVTLRASADAARDGQYVITWPDEHYVGIGEVVDRDNGSVTRTIRYGEVPRSSGEAVSISNWSPKSTPKSETFDFDEVDVNTELGEMSAWLVEGDSDTWAISVHGRNRQPGARAETLRALPSIAEKNYPTLSISYRNDYGAPSSPDKYSHWGQTEWRDLEAALKYAKRRGAKHFVLFGWSMGAMVILELLRNSPLAGEVVGLVFSSPMLNMKSVVRQELMMRRLPGILTAPLIALSDARSHSDFTDMSALTNPPSVRPPLLLMHGASDSVIPVKESRALSRASNNIGWKLVYEEYPGANHTGEWNSDHKRYRDALDTFLGNLRTC